MRKCKGSYCRKGKTPHRYSAHLKTWEAAKRSGDPRRAEEAAAEHEKAFGYRRNPSQKQRVGR